MPHFDFAAAARKIVILMTVDGTDDDLICIDGVEKYTFADADADDLPVNERSVVVVVDDEEEEEQEQDEEEQDEEEQRRAGGAGALEGSDHDHQEGEEDPAHRCPRL